MLALLVKILGAVEGIPNMSKKIRIHVSGIPNMSKETNNYVKRRVKETYSVAFAFNGRTFDEYSTAGASPYLKTDLYIRKVTYKRDAFTRNMSA